MSLKSVKNNLKHYPLAVVSVVVILLCLVVIFLRSDVLTELEAQENDLNSRIRTIEKNIINSNGLADEVALLESKVKVLKERLFDRNQRSLNTNFFYSFEDKVNVLVTGVSQLPTEDAALGQGGVNELKLYSALVYEVSLEGSFTELLRFLYQLHMDKPLIRVADFQVADAARSAPGLLAAKLRVLVLARND